MFSIGWLRPNYEMGAFPFLPRVVFILKSNRIKIATLLIKFCCMFTVTRTNILTVLLFVDEDNLNNRSNVEENWSVMVEQTA